MTENEIELLAVASRDKWREARTELLAKEKELTRARDELNAERRRLPMVEIKKEYASGGGFRTVRVLSPRYFMCVCYYSGGWGRSVHPYRCQRLV